MDLGVVTMSSGAMMFVRYAYPPNQRGYCGPTDPTALQRYGGSLAQSAVDFTPVAKAFTGAWPYLELIAAAAEIPDPLDARVVEAYWIGNELLDLVSPTTLGTAMEDLMRSSVGQFSNLALGGFSTGLAHHSFHVFCIYPWAGLLGNERMHAHALNILDKCRVRAAQVVAITDGRLILESRPLIYADGLLAPGPAVREATNGEVSPPAPGSGDGRDEGVRVGDWVAVHWDWICDRLTQHQMEELARCTDHHVQIVNDKLASSAAQARD